MHKSLVCNKMAWDSASEARKFNKVLKTSKHKPGKKFIAYICPKCGRYHLTSSTRKNPKEHRRNRKI